MRLAVYHVLQLLLVLLLASCQGSSTTVSPGAATPGGTPSFAELQAALLVEFDRLGVDPDKTPATAPTGFSNAVSNLAAYVEDPDGPGGNVATAVHLTWVERVTGDYNQDGVVGISDLTPMGQRWESHVGYYVPGELPAGDPEDDGGTGMGNPATPGSGADNWRLARIDGNGDGIINISDITAIGQHWQERTVGYRVYRIRPGETQFTMLLNADDPSLPYTVPRGSTFPPGENAVDPHRPVIFQFTDDQLGAAQGFYEYYVAPFDDGDSSEGQASLMATANLDGGGGGSMPPVGVLTANPTMGEHPLEVTWDMSGSYDVDGHLTKYEWDMDQDNTTWEIETYPNPVQTIIYNTPGTKTQWVRVTDNDGHTSMAFSKVLVAAPGGNYPPLAQVTGSPPEGPIPLEVTWDASASSDIDGSIAKYEWDMDGDPSTFEYDSGAVASYVMTYNTGGEKIQWVRVTDDQGATDTAFAVVHVFGGGSTAPTALLGANPASGTAPLTVSFSASASFDPDGNIVKYEFDWEGNGSWNHDNGAVPDALHLYGMAGTYAPTVRVTDNDGLTDEMSIPVQVYPGASWHVQTVDDGSLANDNVGAWNSLAVIHGHPAISYLNVTTQQLQYVRATSPDGAGWSAPKTPDNGSSLGYYTTLVASNHGAPAISYCNYASTELKFVIASDDYGNSWDPPAVVDNVAPVGDFAKMVIINHLPGIAFKAELTGNLYYVSSSDFYGQVGSWTPRTPVDTSAVDVGWISVADVGGYPAIAYHSIANNSLLYNRATSTNGTTWGGTVTIETTASNVGTQCDLQMVGTAPYIAYINETSSTTSLAGAADATGGSWNPPTQLLASRGYFDYSIVGGNPAVAHGYFSSSTLFYKRAIDPQGTNWGTAETVDNSVDVGHWVSMVELSSGPAIAYFDGFNNTLKFAAYY